jgi:DNA-binding GntR family transcriptional regulator
MANSASAIITNPVHGAIGYKTMQTIVTDHLRTIILTGQLPPGAELRQDELASQFGVSRMPVREALRVLQSEGLVAQKPHRKAVVVSLRSEDIEEIFAIRALLEGRAAARAASRLTNAMLTHLAEIHAEMGGVDHDVERWLALNHDFHTTIYEACGWPRLLAMINALRNTVQPYLRLTFSLLGRSAHAEHGLILHAAEVRDPALLARLTEEHLERTARGLMGYLREQRQETGTEKTGEQ